MKVNITTIDNLLFVLDRLGKNDDIEIEDLDSSTIPYLDLLVDYCKMIDCEVRIKEQLLIDLDILEHFSDKVQIC